MDLSRIGQIALPVSDASRAESFYGETLGLKKLFRYGDLVFFDCAGVRLMLEGQSKPFKIGDSVCHYFMISGIENVADELAAKGVKFEGPPHLIARMPDHELWMAFFKDPDGHFLALMEEKR